MRFILELLLYVSLLLGFQHAFYLLNLCLTLNSVPNMMKKKMHNLVVWQFVRLLRIVSHVVNHTKYQREQLMIMNTNSKNRLRNSYMQLKPNQDNKERSLLRKKRTHPCHSCLIKSKTFWMFLSMKKTKLNKFRTLSHLLQSNLSETVVLHVFVSFVAAILVISEPQN